MRNTTLLQNDSQRAKIALPAVLSAAGRNPDLVQNALQQQGPMKGSRPDDIVNRSGVGDN
jgi:hypothetical protein